MDKKIFKEIKSLFSVSILDKILVLIKGYFLMYYLKPSEYGLINIINQVTNLSKYSDLGFNSVVERDYSYHIIKNPKKAKEIKNLGYTSEIIISIFFFILIFFISFSYYENQIIFIGIIFSSLAFIFRKIINIYKVDFKINIKFLKFSKINLIQSLILNLLVIIGVVFIGIYAPLIIPPIALFIVTIYLYNFYQLNYKFYFNYLKFKELINISVKLGGLTVLTGLGIYFERFFILEKYNLEVVGYFAVIFFIIYTFQILIYDFVRPYMPRSREAIGAGNLDYLRTSVLKPTLYSIPLLLLIIFVSAYVFPEIIYMFLDKYQSSVPILINMLPIIFYIGITTFSGYILYSKGIDDFLSIYLSHISYILLMIIFYFFLSDNLSSYEIIGLIFTICHFLKSIFILFGSFKIFYSPWIAVSFSVMINILPLILIILINDKFYNNILQLFFG